jgi:hypothetical protein
MTTNYYFPFYYTKLGVGTAPSAAPMITVVDFSDNILVNAQALTALANITGAYVYIYSGADNLHLVGKATTTDVTIDQRDLVVEPSISIVMADLATIKADYARRTDVVTSVAISSTVAAAVSSGTLAISTAYTLQQSITSTMAQDLSAATKLWLAVKKSTNDTDNESLIFIEKTAGLTRVNGAAYLTTADGSLTVTGSSGAWVIAIFIDDPATDLLSLNSNCIAGLKALIGGNTYSVWDGTASIVNGPVKAVA